MKKSPFLSAVLQFFLFGGGWLYNGRRMAAGAVATVGGCLAQGAEIYVSPPVTNQIPAVWPFLITGFVVLKVGLALDAYREAQAINAES